MPIEPEARPAQRIGVIDIGSNSVRFVVYELYGAAFTPIYNEKVLAGLGRDLHLTGKLHPEGSQQAFGALERFKILAKAQNLSEVLIAATAALRDAKDAPGFINKVRDEIGFDIQPLSGEREAYMSAMGVVAGDRRAHGLAADLGGASLELIGIDQGRPLKGVTYPLGPFAMYEGVFKPEHLRPQIEKTLQSYTTKPGQNLYLIGGAWRNLALIHQKRSGYPLRVAHNYEMDIQTARGLAQWAVSKDGIHELLNWQGVSSRRADTLPYAGLLLDVLLDKLRPDKVVTAPGGLRDGLLYASLPETVKLQIPLFDACRALARGNQQGVDFGQPLYEFLQELSAVFPHTFDTENENRLRKAACLLSGIGKGLHPDHKAKMVFQTVLFAPFPGLTHKERAYLALMIFCSYTGKDTTPKDDALTHLLSDEERLSARIYGEAMRVGAVLSGRSSAALAHYSLQVRDNTIILNVEPGYGALIIDRCRLRLQKLANFASKGFEIKTPQH